MSDDSFSSLMVVSFDVFVVLPDWDLDPPVGRDVREVVLDVLVVVVVVATDSDSDSDSPRFFIG